MTYCNQSTTISMLHTTIVKKEEAMKQESLDLLDEMSDNIIENNNNLEILVSYCQNNPSSPLKNITELLRQVSLKQKKVLDDSNKFACDLYKYLFKVD